MQQEPCSVPAGLGLCIRRRGTFLPVRGYTCAEHLAMNLAIMCACDAWHTLLVPAPADAGLRVGDLSSAGSALPVL